MPYSSFTHPKNLWRIKSSSGALCKEKETVEFSGPSDDVTVECSGHKNPSPYVPKGFYSAGPPETVTAKNHPPSYIITLTEGDPNIIKCDPAPPSNQVAGSWTADDSGTTLPEG
jgi:hypothetical protein